jgi:membrane peptidoglycan carboxypeptidase
MNMRDATADSVNVWFAQLIADIGPDSVAEAAKRMGVRGPNVSIPPVCSITLGSVEVNPLAMTTGFATLANLGAYCQPYAISEIRSRTGRLLYKAKPNCKQVVDPKIAATVTSLLEGVLQFGTAAGQGIGRPEAGKTGTGQENKDAWFLGYIPQLATGVWVGYSKKAYPMTSLRVLGGGPAFGGRLAAPIWHDFMTDAVRNMPILGFPSPLPTEGGNVPDVVGKTQAEATQILTAANFTPVVTTADSTEPAGTVFAQAPCGGCHATLGTRVTIQVSNGVAPKAKVPNVVGSTKADATAALEGAGFVVKVVYKTVTDPKKDGVVVSQQPSGGTQAAQGTTVTILVGKMSGPTPTPSP